ncbi:MAG: molybdenum cofactor biosynthesis protein MoaD, partial [Terriglobia bacterium]
MLKEIVGRSAEEIDLPEGADLGSVFQQYAARQPRLRELASSIVAARNQEFADLSTPLADGDEVAFLPPVSGGVETDVLEMTSGEHYFALTRHAIDTRAIIARLLTGVEGAVITFEGTVRNNTKGRATRYLDYECYEAMALKMLAKIGCEVAQNHAVSRVAMVHRLGRMLIGETSVAV